VPTEPGAGVAVNWGKEQHVGRDAAIGAVAGVPIPVVGPVVGAAVGAIAGVIKNVRSRKK
jgi:hypothetical protein